MTLQFTAYPCAVPPAYVSGGFKAIYGDYEHSGVDVAAPIGTEILWTGNQPADVVYHRPGDGWGDGSFGVCAVVDVFGTPYWVVYAHLQEGDWVAGTHRVNPGMRLGRVGMTGLTTGPHTHWGMSEGDGGVFATMRSWDESEILRIGNPKLLDPEAFLVAAPAPPPEPTLADVAASLNNLNTVVIGLRDAYQKHGHGGPV